MNNQGKLIVIDGIDGSGKTTQIDLLSQYLSDKSIPYEIISFPRYEDNLYGTLIRRYLEGEFGGIKDVNPYLLALAFAGDRALAKPLMESWLNSRKLVIANRYVSSSKAHLGANVAENKREEFMEWLDQLEYGTHKLPKPDLNLLLNVDPRIGQKNVEGKHKDLHEQDIKHLEQAAKIYLELAKAETNWQLVNCMEGDKMASKENIHKQITAILSKLI